MGIESVGAVICHIDNHDAVLVKGDALAVEIAFSAAPSFPSTGWKQT